MGPLNSRAVTSALVLLIVVMLGERIGSLIMSFRQPIVYLGARAEPEVIKPKDPLVVLYSVDRSFYCKTDANRFIINVKTEMTVWRERSIAGSTAVGKSVNRNVLILNPPLPAGEYKLRTILYSECYNGAHVAMSPDVYFTVID